MKKGNIGILNIILFIISLVLTIIFKNFIGALIAVLTLILSIIDLKSKNVLKESSYKLCEEQLQTEASRYQLNNNLTPDSNGYIVITTGEIITTCAPDCNGYVVIDTNKDTYNAYLKCKDYTTTGYNKNTYETRVVD